MSTISCQQRQFGTLETGQTVTYYSLRNTSGMTVNLLNYGAILNAVQIPDLRGEMHEITLGSQRLADLQANPLPSGSVLSHIPERYGIDLNGLQRSLWQSDSTAHQDEASVKLSLKNNTDLKYSKEKLEYQLEIEYTLTATNELIIQSTVSTNIALPIFLTHRPIWNLSGTTDSEINDHILQIWATQCSTLDKAGLLNSELTDIQHHPEFNFQQPQRIGEKRTQMPLNDPYEICFQLEKQQEEALANTKKMPLAARVKAPVSGRTLEVYTPQSGLHLDLQSNAQQVLQGFCLNPMPLIRSTHRPTSTEQVTHQTTVYKLVW